jgi:hypothetical protein
MIKDILDAVVTRVRQAAAPTERSTRRNGVLSYKKETHAFVTGLYAGVRYLRFPGPSIATPSTRAEPSYYFGGYVAGSIVQVLSFVGVAIAVGYARR